MKNSLKAGIISGLVAGFVLGIAVEFFNQIAALIGLFEPWWRQINTGNIIINIPIFGLYGIILGAIYSRVYDLIPSKGFLKGLVYGLFLWFIVSIRSECFDLAYGRLLTAAGHIFVGFFYFSLFGLVLGILYDELIFNEKYLAIEELKIKAYNMRIGILPGAIAGICGGLAASVFAVIGHITGYYGVAPGGELISTIDYWMSQAGAHIFMNMLWGAIFGAIFAKVYFLVPGKDFKKGFCYGLIMFLITSFYLGIYCVFWLIFHNNWVGAQYTAGALWITGGANGIVFALVLGLLYRKPTK